MNPTYQQSSLNRSHLRLFLYGPRTVWYSQGVVRASTKYRPITRSRREGINELLNMDQLLSPSPEIRERGKLVSGDTSRFLSKLTLVSRRSETTTSQRPDLCYRLHALGPPYIPSCCSRPTTVHTAVELPHIRVVRGDKMRLSVATPDKLRATVGRYDWISQLIVGDLGFAGQKGNGIFRRVRLVLEPLFRFCGSW